MGLERALLAFVLLTVAATAQGADRDPLGSIGFYSNGCLDSASRVIGDEPGLLKLFVERERWYGNPTMINLLIDLGRAYHRELQLDREQPVTLERIQLGDIAQEGGGRVTRHASHQTGLDADIVYMRKDHRETKPDRGAEASFDELFVKAGKVTANLDAARQWWVWKWVYRTGKVDRIFVDPKIKRFFCEHGATLEPDDHVERAAILRMLRPYPDHKDHFHMRLVCPEGDSRCVHEPPVSAGSGCGDADVETGNGDDEMDGSKPAGPSGLSGAPIADFIGQMTTPVRALPRECSDHGRFPRH